MVCFGRQILCVFFTVLACTCLAKTIVVPVGTNIIDGNDNYSFVKAGDTLLLRGELDYLLVKNLVGTPSKHIVISNFPGEIVKINASFRYGLSIRGVKYFDLTGSDVGAEKGIQVSNTEGSGVGIGDLSTNYSVSGLEIGPIGVGPGILAKTDPDCSFLSVRANFLQDSTVFHHNYIHDTDTEGIYLGYTFYDGKTIRCNGRDTLVYAHLIKNAEVHHNVFERTGWDAIQLSSTPNAKVYNNVVVNDSQRKTEYQMNGIIVGAGFSGKVYNNLIVDGEGTGIFVKGKDHIVIENNIILNPGLYNQSESGKYGMYLDFQSDGAVNLHVSHNLIANPRFEGIRFLGKDNNTALVANNLVYTDELFEGDLKTVISQNAESQLILLANIITTNSLANSEYFVEDSLDSKAAALGVNQGKSIATHFPFDFYGRDRNFGEDSVDVGPFEQVFDFENIPEDQKNNCIPAAEDIVSIYNTNFKLVSKNSAWGAKPNLDFGIYFVYVSEKKCFSKVLIQ